MILPSRQDWEGLLEGGPAPGEGRGSHQQHTFTEHLHVPALFGPEQKQTETPSEGTASQWADGNHPRAKTRGATLGVLWRKAKAGQGQDRGGSRRSHSLGGASLELRVNRGPRQQRATVRHLKTAWRDQRTLGRQVEGSLGLGRWEWKGS